MKIEWFAFLLSILSQLSSTEIAYLNGFYCFLLKQAISALQQEDKVDEI